MKILKTVYEDHFSDAVLQDPLAIRNFSMALGRPYPNFPVGLKVKMSSGELPGWFLAGPAVVVSREVLTAMKKHGASIEAYPVQLVSSRMVPSDLEFSILNILEVRDCLDRERSRFIEEGGFATQIRQLRIKRFDGCERLPILRVARTIPSIICVSEALASDLSALEVDGLELISDEQWTNPMQI